LHLELENGQDYIHVPGTQYIKITKLLLKYVVGFFHVVFCFRLGNYLQFIWITCCDFENVTQVEIIMAES
jgi:hypothetical protein